MRELLNIINSTIVEYAGISNLLTIIVTIIGAIYITGKINRTKLDKIKFELEQKYASALFKKRVEIYPSLSAILSGYQKIILSKKNDKNNFCIFLDMLDKWHTKNALFLSSTATKISDMSRLYFRSLSNKLDSQNESGSHGKLESNLSEAEWKDIYQILGDYELTLRADLGTFPKKPTAKTDEVKIIFDSLEKKIQSLPDKIEPFSK